LTAPLLNEGSELFFSTSTTGGAGAIRRASGRVRQGFHFDDFLSMICRARGPDAILLSVSFVCQRIVNDSLGARLLFSFTVSSASDRALADAGNRKTIRGCIDRSGIPR